MGERRHAGGTASRCDRSGGRLASSPTGFTRAPTGRPRSLTHHVMDDDQTRVLTPARRFDPYTAHSLSEPMQAGLRAATPRKRDEESRPARPTSG
jgi:hypothetical protein